MSSTNQSTIASSNKSSRVFQTKLEPINEETNSKPTVTQPTKVDTIRDIQILTLNDDGNNQQQATIEEQDEAPF
jgi:hypothetical protein